ncbi:MAG: Transglycosylase domain protein [Gemmatimonadetes bacterium]|nr:Transglycosylase domain protein [Gemmatimonadota bacterium]
MSPNPGSIPLATFALLAACVGGSSAGSARAAGQATTTEIPAAQAGPARFFWRDGMRLGHPAAERIVNANGSPRITSPARYDQFWREVGPRLARWAGQPCVGLNPNFVAALLAKESGFDPTATSAVPAVGFAQITAEADEDMLQRVPTIPCMADAQAWPRHPLVHSPAATKAKVDSLIASGAVNARTEYLLDPAPATRAAMYQLRIVADIWRTHDEYAPFARRVLNAGAPLTEDQVLDLVTVSYNQGYRYVHDLMLRHGAAWKDHLNDESRDYLERIRTYTLLFQAAPAGR